MSTSLASLPVPTLIAERDPQLLFEELLARFKTLNPDYAYYLMSDPVVKELQTLGYAEFMFRAFVNEMARQGLIAYATEAWLDHLGAREGVTRMLIDAGNSEVVPPVAPIYESDDRFRDRILTKIAGRSSAGPADHYRYHAMSADVRVLDAYAYSPDFDNSFNMGGRVNIALLSSEPGNVASLNLIDTVRAVLLNPKVRVVSDILTVEAAAAKEFALHADVTLDHTAPFEVFEGLADLIVTKFNAIQALGRDVTKAWMINALMVDGVYDVTLLGAAASGVVVQPNEFPLMVEVQVNFAGFSRVDDFNLNDNERRAIYAKVYRYYVDFCVRTRRPYTLIAADLSKEDRDGIIQPTVAGLANFLGVPGIRDTDGHLLPEDELAFLIEQILAPYYDAATN